MRQLTQKFFLLTIPAMLFGAPSPSFATPSFSADYDGSGTVDEADAALFTEAFGTTSGETYYDPRFDANEDGAVSLIDFGALRGQYGAAAVPEPTAGLLFGIGIITVAALVRRKTTGDTN